MKSQLKSVTTFTSFRAVVLVDNGERLNAMVDQDGDIIGLISSDKPYVVQDAHAAASRGIKLAAPYKAYAATNFAGCYYLLESKTENYDDDPAIRDMQIIRDSAKEMLRVLAGESPQSTSATESGTTIDGECYHVTETSHQP